MNVTSSRVGKSAYAFQTLTYIIGLAVDGKYKTLNELGVSPEQIKEILSLNTEEVLDIVSINLSYIDITFDSKSFDIALKIKKDRAVKRKEINCMLIAGSSFPVMKFLYGLGTQDFAHLKRLLGLPRKEGGRNGIATDKQKYQIWNIVKIAGNLENKELPKLLLRAHQETGVKIGTMWLFLQEAWGQQQNKDEM